jgi:hypothetical protein
MQKIIAALLLLVSSLAHADANMDRQSYCANYGAMFTSIAAWRDQGEPPERTLDLIAGVKGIPLQVKKDSINAIYFDKSLAHSRGRAFGQQVHLNCLAGK